MDIITILVSTISLGLLIVPVYLHNIKKQRKQKEIMDEFSALMKARGLIISEFDLLRQSIIGIDESRQYLVFHKFNGQNVTTTVLSLNDFESCRKIEQIRNIPGKNGSNHVLETIGLELGAKSGKSGNKIIKLYELNSGLQILNEIPVMSKWHAIVVAEIKKRSGK